MGCGSGREIEGFSVWGEGVWGLVMRLILWLFDGWDGSCLCRKYSWRGYNTGEEIM